MSENSINIDNNKKNNDNFKISQSYGNFGSVGKERHEIVFSASFTEHKTDW